MLTTTRLKILLTGTFIVCHAASAWALQLGVPDIFDESHMLAYLVAALLIGLFLLLFHNRIICFAQRDVNEQNRSRNAQLALVLRACRIRVWTYDVASRRYRRLAKDGSVEAEYLPIDFAQFFERDDFERMRQQIFNICDGELKSASINMRGHHPKDNKPQKEYEVNIEILNTDRQGRPSLLVGMQRDITESLRKKAEVSQMLMRYQTVFDQSLVDMIYYNADGVMTDINDKACETFGITSRKDFLLSKPTVKDNPGYAVAQIEDNDTTRFTTVFDLGDLESAQVKLNDKMYYEMEFTAIRDVDGRLSGIFSAGRNVTEVVANDHRQRQATRQLQQATESIKDYIDNINYALRVNEVRLMNYYPQTHLLEISSDLSQAQFTLTQMRCIDLVADDHQHHVRRILRQMDHRMNIKIEQTLRTIITDQQRRNVWLAFSIMPIYDATGKVDHYFGMFRNETEMVATEHQLMQETQKAQETELLKNAFLMNMSYEIRSPLNAVMGFARLLNDSHDEEDEPVFIEQIKQNTKQLLDLVNDVLFLSRLDANMVEIKRQPCDFAPIFDANCQIGWATIRRPGVKTIVENPYDHIVVDIDEQNVGKIIQMLCTFAAFNTHEGIIRTKYEYRRGALNITVEDTGTGIDSESLPKAFDRFANNSEGEHCGSGLGLPIVKELVEQMGGIIDLTSELEKGTTVWVSIPCDMTTFDKKKEIQV